MNFQSAGSLLSNNNSAIRSSPNPTTAVKWKNIQKNSETAMKQWVRYLDHLYKRLERSSKHLENLEIIKRIRKAENVIKELKAKEATAMSIKKENLVNDIIKTHKTDNSSKCKD